MEVNVEVGASVIVNGIKANKFNKDEDAKAAFAEGVVEVTGGTVTNIVAKTVNTQRRSLMDEKATEVSFPVVLEELGAQGRGVALHHPTLVDVVIIKDEQKPRVAARARRAPWSAALPPCCA